MVIYKAFGVLLLVAVKTAKCIHLEDKFTRILLIFLLCLFHWQCLAFGGYGGLYYNKF